MPLAVEHKLWFQHSGAPTNYTLTERDLSWKVHWTLNADCRAGFVAMSNSDGFFVVARIINDENNLKTRYETAFKDKIR